MELVTPAGAAPLEGVDRIRILARQGEGDVREAEGPVTADGFDVALPIVDLVLPVTLTVRLTGPSTELIGAPPVFIPLETGGLVRVPVGQPDTCEVIAGMVVDSPRSALGLSPQGTFALTIGGRGSSGASDAAGYLDLLRLEGDAFDPLDVPLGVAVAVPLSRALALVVSEGREPFIYDVSSATAPVLPVVLHPGAGLRSALAALPAGGAVVAGGDVGGLAVSDVTWIGPMGDTSTTRLVVARIGAAIATFGDAVLIAAGADGGPLAERATAASAAFEPVAPAFDDGVRVGAALFVDPASGTALLVGGLGADGSIRADTVVLSGCPSACVATAGPAWPSPRPDTVAVHLPSGGGLIVGGTGPVAVVDRVILDAEGARFEAAGSLATPRQAPAALALEQGVTFVVGGLGPEGPRADVEVCFPPALGIP